MIRPAGRATADLAEVAGKSKGAAFRDSAIVTLLNPKSIGFFVAFVPQFTVMIATFVGLGGVNALAYALLAATLRSKVARPRQRRGADRACHLHNNIAASMKLRVQAHPIRSAR